MATQSDNVTLFNRAVDLAYENEQLNRRYRL